jgi:hypothetical protein
MASTSCLYAHIGEIFDNPTLYQSIIGGLHAAFIFHSSWHCLSYKKVRQFIHQLLRRAFDIKSYRLYRYFLTFVFDVNPRKKKQKEQTIEGECGKYKPFSR